ncbi:SGNH/GDSL hydrolase family protein [Bradyrhizobium diazoefficiens]|nr:SGNH/GDSL hydrolase family protein [Bradyrhizobium diazoefficiens]MBR0700180.1 SGNH/GDSL hydrolase family protein [Bradyrhizobium diazoefficiens]MBR0768515.1 SGNH/GDSL hydrolase family protein [Bradyrhizobium diazoefficiens]
MPPAIGLGLGMAFTDLGTTSTPLIEGYYVDGDSFGQGGSGGGGGYYQFDTQLNRIVSAAGMPTTFYNGSVSGQGTTQIADRFISRPGGRYRYNIICMGRNTPSAATVVADAQRCINSLKPGEILIFTTVHNYADGTEDTGSAGFIANAAKNSGVAALCDNVRVFQVDTLSEFLFAYALGDATDTAAVALGRPAPSLVSATDKLHPNSVGYDVYARQIFAVLFRLWQSRTAAIVNRITNGTFNSNVSGWSALDSATLVWDAGGFAKVTGGGNFRGMSQQVALSGQSGKRSMAKWDLLDLSTATKFRVRGQQFTFSGGDYPSVGDFASPLTFNATVNVNEAPMVQYAPRRGHNMLLFFAANAAEMALTFSVNNDATQTWSIDNIEIYDVG